MVWDSRTFAIGNSTRSLADETALAGRNRPPVHAGQRVSRSVALRRRSVGLHSCAPRLGEAAEKPEELHGAPHLVGRPIRAGPPWPAILRGVWLASPAGHGGLSLAWLARLGVRSACPTPDLWMCDLRWALLEPGEL
jgi:hypothetical protein